MGTKGSLTSQRIEPLLLQCVFSLAPSGAKTGNSPPNKKLLKHKLLCCRVAVEILDFGPLRFAFLTLVFLSLQNRGTWLSVSASQPASDNPDTRVNNLKKTASVRGI